MIRRAAVQDIENIMAIVKTVTARMNGRGNYQWYEGYPVSGDFYNDVTAGELFTEVDATGEIKSFACLNRVQPDEYVSACWKTDREALVIHRMAVNPRFQGNGEAKKMMLFAEEKARELGLYYLRSDTCSLNTAMNALFNRLGYSPAGIVQFADSHHDYNCYEKQIT